MRVRVSVRVGGRCHPIVSCTNGGSATSSSVTLSAQSRTERFVCVDCGVLAPAGQDPAGSSSLQPRSRLAHSTPHRRGRRDGGSGARCATCYAQHRRGSPAVPRPHAPAAEQRFIDFQTPAGSLEETSRFRSSWLASSMHALRARGYFQAYRAGLPRFHGPVFESVAGTWLPIGIAVAHDETIDRLWHPRPRSRWGVAFRITRSRLAARASWPRRTRGYPLGVFRSLPKEFPGAHLARGGLRHRQAGAERSGARDCGVDRGVLALRSPRDARGLRRNDQHGLPEGLRA